jgi:hypothetical protein
VNRGRIWAWALGVGAAATCVVAGVVCVGLGVPRTFLLDFLDGVLLALLGALVAARQPRNSIGWLMIVFGYLAGVFQVVAAYGFAALGLHHGEWPLGSAAAWIGAWIWTPAVGFIALIAVRFPDGRRGRFGRFVDGIYIVGTALFAIPIALAKPADELSDSSLPFNEWTQELPYFRDPFAAPISLRQVQGIAIVLILLAFTVAVVSLILRYREAKGDERLQIKWFAYAGALSAAAVVFGGLATTVFGVPLYLAFTPLEAVGLTIPAAIGIAILRYRLYDIDLIINRTLVYVGLTAILAAMYAAVVALLNRLFISVSGQRSDIAFFVTAFVVVAAAYPVKDGLQRQVDRRVPHSSPSSVLDQFRSSVDAVVSVMDVNRMAHRLLDQAIEAFNAQGAAVYLHSSGDSTPLYTRGRVDGEVEVDVPLQYDGKQYGRLVLARRRGDADYTAGDRVALQRSADSVGEALALAAHLGFKPLSKAERTGG